MNNVAETEVRTHDLVDMKLAMNNPFGNDWQRELSWNHRDRRFERDSS